MNCGGSRLSLTPLVPLHLIDRLLLFDLGDLLWWCGRRQYVWNPSDHLAMRLLVLLQVMLILEVDATH